MSDYQSDFFEPEPYALARNPWKEQYDHIEEARRKAEAEKKPVITAEQKATWEELVWYMPSK